MMKPINLKKLATENVEISYKPSSPPSLISQKAQDELMAIEGVQGVGVGKNELIIYVRNALVKLPSEIEGHKVNVKIIGEIKLG